MLKGSIVVSWLLSWWCCSVKIVTIIDLVSCSMCTCRFNYRVLKQLHVTPKEACLPLFKVTGPVFSYKLRYIVGFWLVEMVISTNQNPTIYRNLYENTGPGTSLWPLQFLCKLWEPKGFFQFEITINILVSSFHFIWIPMLSGYGSTATILILLVRRLSLCVRIWRLQTSDSDV